MIRFLLLTLIAGHEISGRIPVWLGATELGSLLLACLTVFCVMATVRGSVQRQCSAWPSAKDKLSPRPCQTAGTSIHASPRMGREKNPSLMVKVLSSRKTLVAEGEVMTIWFSENMGG